VVHAQRGFFFLRGEKVGCLERLIRFLRTKTTRTLHWEEVVRQSTLGFNRDRGIRSSNAKQ